MRRQSEQPTYVARNFDNHTRSGENITKMLFASRTGHMMISNVIPALAFLLLNLDDTSRAVLCHSEVLQVTNFRSDGNFCMFRGLQMIVSYVQASHHPDAGMFGNNIPSIIQLQEMIEVGFARLVRWGSAESSKTIGLIPLQNNYEEYRLKGTRKGLNLFHAWLLLQSRGVKCQVHVFAKDKTRRSWIETSDDGSDNTDKPDQIRTEESEKPEGSRTAASKLFDYLEQHFASPSPIALDSSESVRPNRVSQTRHAPVLLV